VQQGVRLIQYRSKDKSLLLKRRDLHTLMTAVPQACLVVNDDGGLAQALDLGGHLGKEDGGLARARAHLGPQAIVGASCYNDLGHADHALAAGASYLAFGSVFASPTKPGASRAPFDLFSKARALFPDTPLVAIGGITPENAPLVLQAGADAIAVISAVFSAPDPCAVIDQFQETCHAFSV
jgi:thiamine-phosphate pyrophosphorylase